MSNLLILMDFFYLKANTSRNHAMDADVLLLQAAIKMTKQNTSNDYIISF